jgi:hypothetical protein
MNSLLLYKLFYGIEKNCQNVTSGRLFEIMSGPFKGSDQRKNRWVWSNVNTRYLVWRCGDGGSFVGATKIENGPLLRSLE